MPTKPAKTTTSKSSNTALKRETMGGLAKGIEVMLAFSRERPSMTLTEVANTVQLTPATARRCLLTLEELGYVSRVDRQYILRPRILELGAAFLDSMHVDSLTKNRLEELAVETGDSAAMAVLDRTDIVYVARASARTVMRLEAHIGTRYPAYCTSLGRVLLAGLSAPRLEQYFKTATFEKLTRHTITDPAALQRVISDCRRKGYAVVTDELAYGVASIAVPVLDAAGHTVAAINLSGHSQQTSAIKLIRGRLPLLRRLANLLTKELPQGSALTLLAPF